MIRNKTPKLLAAILLGILKGQRVTNFTIPQLSPSLRWEVLGFFEEVEFEGGNKVKDIVFEEEFISLPTVVIDNDQVSVSNIVQETNPELQNNVVNLTDQGQQVVYDEQTQPVTPANSFALLSG